jgi:hypothetical protein
VNVLTVRQPWAWAVFHAGKDVENRGWWRPQVVDAPLAVLAGRRYDPDADQYLGRLGITVPDRDRLVFGAVVGVVSVTGVHPASHCHRGAGADEHPGGPYRCSLWAMGADGKQVWHWALACPRLMDPLPYRGELGLRVLPDEVEHEVRSRLAARMPS